MSIAVKAPPAKLVVSLFMGEKVLLQDVASKLVGFWGTVDMVSPWLAFDQTDYYHAEMGSPLFRRFIVFSDLIQQEALAGVKVVTNDLETAFSKAGKRLVNIDPGYVTAERFVLASGKNYTHRIYLSKGIYADLTLIYQKGRFRPLEWTYPDYAGDAITGFLQSVRNRYLYQLKASGNRGEARAEQGTDNEGMRGQGRFRRTET